MLEIIVLDKKKFYNNAFCQISSSGETPTGIVTANGVTKVSCIDPRDANAIEGFTMPDLSDGADEPECQGATVCAETFIKIYKNFEER